MTMPMIFKAQQEVPYLDAIMTRVASVLSRRRGTTGQPRKAEAARQAWSDVAECARHALTAELIRHAKPGTEVPAVDSISVEELSDRIRSEKGKRCNTGRGTVEKMITLSNQEVVALLAEILIHEMQLEGTPIAIQLAESGPAEVVKIPS
jgi:hypothetical protein